MKKLFVRPFVDEALGNSSYLIASQETGLAAVIDPQRDVDKYVRVAEGLGLKVAYALDTHLHADFVSGARELAHAIAHAQGIPHTHHHSDQRVVIGASAAAEMEFEHLALQEGDTVSLGDWSVGVLATPGHTPESISFTLTHKGAPKPTSVFTGGSLIVGGAGRPDLLGHEHTIPLAHHLYETLHQKLFRLDDATQVYPTHGAGSFCSAVPGDKRVTTIGDERRSNPYYKKTAREEFVKFATTGLGTFPTYYRYMRPINKKGADILGGVPAPQKLEPQQAYDEIINGAVVIDLRTADEYAAGHIVGSFGIPYASPVIRWGGWVVPFGKPVVLVGANAAERKDAVRQLIRIGYDDLRGYLPDLDEWRDLDLPWKQAETISQEVVCEWIQKEDRPLLLDVRFPNEYKEGHLPGAINIQVGNLPDAEDLPHDRPIVIYCRSGMRGPVAHSVLARRGFDNVVLLEGGIIHWQARGYQVETNSNGQG